MAVKFIEQKKKLKNKTILLRIDLDFDPKEISAKFRLARICESIKNCLKTKAKIILISSKGEFKKTGENSLKSFVNLLQDCLKEKIVFIDQRLSEKTKNLILENKSKLILLENLNFYKEEENNDKNFAKELAGLADFYVNDSFGKLDCDVCSIISLPECLPKFATKNIKLEIENIEKARNLKKPSVIVLGGSDILGKIKLLKEIGKKFDHILLGGSLANTFFASLFYKIGSSDFEESKLLVVKNIYNQLKKKIIFPQDFIVGELKNKKSLSYVKLNEEEKIICKRPSAILDIGPKTIEQYSLIIKKAQTIVYCGPMGLWENDFTSHGSKTISRIIAARSSGRSYGIVFGDSGIELLAKQNLLKFMDWFSLGGNVGLKLLRKEKVKGLEKLK